MILITKNIINHHYGLILRENIAIIKKLCSLAKGGYRYRRCCYDNIPHFYPLFVGSLTVFATWLVFHITEGWGIQTIFLWTLVTLRIFLPGQLFPNLIVILLLSTHCLLCLFPHEFHLCTFAHPITGSIIAQFGLSNWWVQKIILSHNLC